MVYIGAIGEEHFFVTEVAAGVRLTKSFADEFGNLKITEAGVSGFKNTGLQNDIRVDFVEIIHSFADGFVPCLLAALGNPGHIGPAHIFHTAIPDHIQALLPVGRVREVHGVEETQSHSPG